MSQGRILPQKLCAEIYVAFDITPIKKKVHLLTDALGPQAGHGVMSGRIGKIDGSLFSDHKDTEHFRAGETVAIHDQINGQISQSVLYLAAGGERIAVVYQKNTIYNIQLLKLRQNFGAHGHGDEKAGAAQLLAKREQADQTDLLCCAHDPSPSIPGRQSRLA